MYFTLFQILRTCWFPGSCHKNYHSLSFSNWHLFSHSSGHQTSETKATPSAETWGRACACLFWLQLAWGFLCLVVHLSKVTCILFSLNLLCYLWRFSFIRICSWIQGSLGWSGTSSSFLPSTALPSTHKVTFTGSGDQQEDTSFPGIFKPSPFSITKNMIEEFVKVFWFVVTNTNNSLFHRFIRLVSSKMIFAGVEI